MLLWRNKKLLLRKKKVICHYRVISENAHYLVVYGLNTDMEQISKIEEVRTNCSEPETENIEATVIQHYSQAANICGGSSQQWHPPYFLNTGYL